MDKGIKSIILGLVLMQSLSVAASSEGWSLSKDKRKVPAILMYHKIDYRFIK